MLRVNDIYSAQKIAIIDKISTPTIFSAGKMIYNAKSTVDYIGCLKGGRMIAFDAKACSDKKFPMGNIKEHQVHYLYDVKRMGGCAFLLVFMELENRMFIVPITDEWLKTFWKQVPKKKKDKKTGEYITVYERKSMQMNDLEYYGQEIVRWDQEYPFCDYLKAAREWRLGNESPVE